MSILNKTYPLSTTGVGWRELDILDKIINQDPRDRPFFENSGMGTARSKEHSWQVRGLRSRAIQAIIEGSDYTYSTTSGPTRVTNFTQIFMDGVEVSGTLMAEKQYGIADIVRDQINLRSVEHGNDIEYSLIRGASDFGNATDVGTQMNGLISSVPSGNETANGYDATLGETEFVSLASHLWRISGTRPDTVLVPPRLQDNINGYSAESATKWIDTTTREITHQILMYHSSYASLQILLSRDLTETALATNGVELVMYNRGMHNKAWLRTTKLRPVADTGDYDRFSMISELTLEYLDNGNSSFHWVGRAG
jgi:hypothetical protein